MKIHAIMVKHGFAEIVPFWYNIVYSEILQSVAPPEKNIGGRNDVIFYDVIRNSDQQVRYVFQQLIFCVAAYLFTLFLHKHSVLHRIIFIGKKHLNYIYVPINHSTLLIYPLTDSQ